MDAPPPFVFETVQATQEVTREFLLWCDTQRILNITHTGCEDCDDIKSEMHLVAKSQRKFDHFALRCPECRRECSVRHGSFFEQFKAPIPAIIRVMVLIRAQVPVEFMLKETRLCEHTVHSIWEKLGIKLINYFRQNPVIFRNDEIVEADETKEKWTVNEYKDYDNELRGRTGEWVLGIRARKTEKVLLIPIVDRALDSVVFPIYRSVETTSTIITDALASYNYIRLEDYIHLVINKKKEGFGRIDDDFEVRVNVNSIEATWAQWRKYLNRPHAKEGRHVYYICKYFMFDRTHSSYLEVIQF